MKKFLQGLGVFAKNLAADIITLRTPMIATGLVTTIAGLLQPFGLDVGPKATVIAAGLVAVGTIGAYVQTRLGGVAVRTNPATQPPATATRSRLGR